MKKCLLAVACMLLMAFTACGGKGQSTQIDMEKAVEDVVAAAGFTDELIEQDASTIARSYQTLDLEKVDGFSCRVSATSATPEEVSIFKAKASSDVADIRAAVDRRVEDQRINFEDYRPEEMPKIENAVIVEKGDYVMLAICPESEAVREILNKL